MNALRDRSDVEAACLALCQPPLGYLSPGGARLRLRGPRPSFGRDAEEMEGFARLLWGAAPLAAGSGGGPVDALVERLREGLINGTNATHPEYWGEPCDNDQRFVEYAAIAFALLIAPGAFWWPLSTAERAQMVGYLDRINRHRLRDNNWLFFRVVVNVALAQRDARCTRGQLAADLDRLDRFYVRDGWYTDGPEGPCDYYAAFAMHFYGLLCAVFMRELDPMRCEVLANRAALFARQFMAWFDDEGAAIPYGRSLTYRFAQGALWGALAFADVDAAPVGVLKGLSLRHLRWWFDRPITSSDGLLTVGYGYPNWQISERYTSPCSPYWALKAFLPLALKPGHPFWSEPEAPAPARAIVVAQPAAGVVLCHDDDHVFALAAGVHTTTDHRHSAAKYSKFCYSSRFGFSVPSDPSTLQAGAYDSMLVLSEGGQHFRVREMSARIVAVTDAGVETEWLPWPDVEVMTWLVPNTPWHVRVHRIRTPRTLLTAEGGFAVALGENEVARPEPTSTTEGLVSAVTEGGVSLVANLYGTRRGEIVRSDPNTNVLHPRAVIPMLVGGQPAGESWLACAVAAVSNRSRVEQLMGAVPAVRSLEGGLDVVDDRGRRLLACR